jgi:lambda repressor-like predicted transcriptional regulator
MKLRDRFRIDWPLVLGQLQKRGLTLRMVAEKIGCSHATLSKLNTGERRVAGYDIGAAALQLLAITASGNDRVDGRVDVAKEIASGDHSHHECSETHSRD